MLSINIIGKTGSGKTTLALALQHFLKMEGFTDITISDWDIVHNSHLPELQSHRLSFLKNQPINISTTQLQR